MPILYLQLFGNIFILEAEYGERNGKHSCVSTQHMVTIIKRLITPKILLIHVLAVILNLLSDYGAMLKPKLSKQCVDELY